MINLPQTTSKSLLCSGRAWFIVISAALFFFYEFIQMNLLNSIAPQLLTALHMTATQLGEMSALYFVANVIFLLPAGILLDRYSIRLIIMTTLGICILGTLLFANVHCYETAMFARFLIGIGAAFCFLSVVKLASRWFLPHKMALIIGVIVSMAMTGGMVAQAPLVFLVAKVGWRTALMLDAALGLIILAWIFFVVKDHPPNISIEQQHRHLNRIGLWHSLRLSLLRPRNWLGGGYSSLMNLLLLLLGGLWGQLYLMRVHHLSHLDAATVSSLLFFGTIIGAPTVGWLSDYLRSRQIPMMIGAIMALLILTLISHETSWSHAYLSLAFLALGFFTSTQVLGYPFVAENTPRLLTAMSVSVVSLCTQSGIALGEPLFGWIMDWHKHAVVGHYLSVDFQRAMWLFFIAFGIATFITFILPSSQKKM